MSKADNPYAPPEAAPEPERLSETSASGSRIDVRPRERFTAPNLRREFGHGLLRMTGQASVIVAAFGASVATFPDDLRLNVIFGVVAIAAAILWLCIDTSYIENTRARIQFAQSHGHAGQPVEMAFIPRLPANGRDLQVDTADDIGVFTRGESGIEFHGDHIDLSVQFCDVADARFRWQWSSPIPTAVIDLPDSFTHSRIWVYFLYSGFSSKWQSRRSAKQLVADIQARLP